MKDIFDIVKFKDELCEIRVRKLISRLWLCDDENRKSYNIKEVTDLISDAIELTIKNPFISSKDECDKLCSDLKNIEDKIINITKEYHRQRTKQT